MGYHSTLDHLGTLMIIVKECYDNKTNVLCCFIDFRKYFNIMPKANLWNRLDVAYSVAINDNKMSLMSKGMSKLATLSLVKKKKLSNSWISYVPSSDDVQWSLNIIKFFMKLWCPNRPMDNMVGLFS